MTQEELHVALPQLRGGPAYARPARPVHASPKPVDPDDFPLEVFMTEEERAEAEVIPARPYVAATDGRRSPQVTAAGDGSLLPRLLRLRALAGRLPHGSG